MPDDSGGTPRESQQKVTIGGQAYLLAGEDVLGEMGSQARAWVLTSGSDQEEALNQGRPDFSIPMGDFSQGAGYTFATVPGVYDHADKWDATAPRRPGLWPKRATLQAMPATVDYQGWILSVSTYIYVMRGRYVAKYAIDDTQDAEWPIIELHDLGAGVIVTGRPVVFKSKGYIPRRSGAGGAIAVFHELSPTTTVVEQQTVTLSGTATGGTYILTWQGNSTAAIAYNANAATVQAALRLVPGLQYVTVTSAGSTPNFTFTVVFTGAASSLGSASPAQLTGTDNMTGGTHPGAGLAFATTVAGTTDTWVAGPVGHEASCFIVNGTKLWQGRANMVAACAVTPTTGANWGADSEVGESGRDVTDLGVYLGDLLVGKTDGMYRFTEDLQSVNETPDLVHVVDNFNFVGMETSIAYQLLPHKSGLIRWRPGAYAFVGPEQEGALEGDKSVGWGRVASIAPYGKQAFLAINDSFDRVGIVASLLPQLEGEKRGADYGVIPHVHIVEGSVADPALIEAVAVVTSQTQPVGPHAPTTWADDASVGTLAWSTPSNAGVTDDSKATAVGAGTTHYLKGTAPPVNIPSGATILGILAEIERAGYSSLVATMDAQSGFITGAQSATWGPARIGTPVQAIQVNSGVQQVGALFNAGFYTCLQGYLGFDTSPIPDAATILSATLAIPGAANLGLAWVCEARLYDYGATLTTADWVTGAALSANTLLATSVNGTAPFIEQGTALRSNINKTGFTRILLCDANQTNNVSPPSGLTGMVFGTPGPTLTVTYKDVLDNVVKLVIGGAVTGTNMADAVNPWPAVDTVASYGGATATWGGLPTPDQANGVGGDFGIVISAVSTGAANFAVDSVNLTVYFTVAGVSDAQSFLIALKIESGRTVPHGQVYKLPRANLPPLLDPNVNHAGSSATLYSSRYAQPSRNVQKTYRELELWLDAAPEANTPGLQLWARVDDGTAYQLLDDAGVAATLLTTGPHTVFFPTTSAAVGHYVQIEFRVPATGGGTVPVAVSFRDAVLRGISDAKQTDTIQATIILGGDGVFSDWTSIRRSARKQLANLRALARPNAAAVPYRDINGTEGFLKVVSYEVREQKFKKFSESVSVAKIVARELIYD